MPPGAPLWVAQSSYRPFWFYWESDVRYHRSITEIPVNARCALVTAETAGQIEADPRWRAARPAPLATVTDNENRHFSLFGLGGNGLDAAQAQGD
jgi:hypothetical protein